VNAFVASWLCASLLAWSVVKTMTIGSGFSGAALGKKLSLKPGMRVWWDTMPATVRAAIETPDLIKLPAVQASIDAIWSGLKLMKRKSAR
jgi:hypothetical protein